MGEGVIVIRGLFDHDLMDRLEKDSQALDENNFKGQTFANLKFGPVFSNTALREVALSSAIPRFVATVLLDMDKDVVRNDKDTVSPASSTLHLLKDAFLAKGGEKKCCGWHVDDQGFWPTNARSEPGVNAWIAIDDMPAKHGGGLA